MASAGTPSSIRLVRVALPLVHSHDASHGSESLREVILIEWTGAGGVGGWGECSTLSNPGYVTETTDEAWRALVRSLGPRALRLDTAGDPADLSSAPAAAAALRDARLDSYLRQQGISLRSHLGGSPEPLKRCAVIAAVGETPQAIAERAVGQVRSGATMIKLKIAPGHDREVLAVVIDAIHPVPLAADANGAYSGSAEIEWIDGLSLAYIEQPFPREWTPEQLADAAARLDTPVALDESVTSMSEMEALAEAGAGTIVSIKPLRLGGIESAVDVGRRAMDLGLGVFVGGMLETGIGRAGALAVASALSGPPGTRPYEAPGSGTALPTDLGPSSSYFAVDVSEPIECDPDGRIRPPSGDGLGRTPDPDLLEQVTVDEVLLRG